MFSQIHKEINKNQISPYGHAHSKIMKPPQKSSMCESGLMYT